MQSAPTEPPSRTRAWRFAALAAVPGPGPQLVDFGANHGDEVGDVAREQPARGNSNLAATVVAAIDDFADPDRFPDPRAPKQLVIFAGTPDQCQGGAYGRIRDAIEKTGFAVISN